MKEQIVLEIRAGIGGSDAALLVKEMVELYKKVAKTENFEIKLLEERNSFTSLYL